MLSEASFSNIAQSKQDVSEYFKGLCISLSGLLFYVFASRS